MNPERQKLIERARELNTSGLPAIEIEERIREVCSEYLIEAKVDVDRLLRNEDWRVRLSALDIVWWGVGATDGIDRSIEILVADPDEDIRAEAVLALYEAARGTPKESRVREAFERVADADESEYVRDAALRYLRKLDERSKSS
ncbi:MAG TPA: HEAT repeat domain-containing protein [Candidatus Sulfotelmatobacter sp.]|nr:HEAT repeat domain-containing protein [Candidatus Sulfotelmatobacter sp.]